MNCLTCKKETNPSAKWCDTLCAVNWFPQQTAAASQGGYYPSANTAPVSAPQPTRPSKSYWICRCGAAVFGHAHACPTRGVSAQAQSAPPTPAPHPNYPGLAPPTYYGVASWACPQCGLSGCLGCASGSSIDDTAPVANQSLVSALTESLVAMRLALKDLRTGNLYGHAPEKLEPAIKAAEFALSLVK